MKKIIDGITYNTATATELGRRFEGNSTDLRHIDETLYRTNKTGVYFLHGYGGPQTDYAIKRRNNEWVGGEAIRPLTAEEAQAWGKKYLSAEEYTDAFPLVWEPTPKLVSRTRLSTTIDLSLADAIRDLSEKSGVPLSKLLDRAISDLLVKENG